MSSVNPSQVPRPHKCPYCPYRFSTIEALRGHQNAHRNDPRVHKKRPKPLPLPQPIPPPPQPIRPPPPRIGGQFPPDFHAQLMEGVGDNYKPGYGGIPFWDMNIPIRPGRAEGDEARSTTDECELDLELRL